MFSYIGKMMKTHWINSIASKWQMIDNLLHLKTIYDSFTNSFKLKINWIKQTLCHCIWINKARGSEIIIIRIKCNNVFLITNQQKNKHSQHLETVNCDLFIEILSGSDVLWDPEKYEVFMICVSNDATQHKCVLIYV